MNNHAEGVDCSLNNVAWKSVPFIIHHVPDAVVVINERDEILMSNSKAEELFGADILRMKGAKCQELFPDWNSQVKPQLDAERGFTQLAMRALGADDIVFLADATLEMVESDEHAMTVVTVRMHDQDKSLAESCEKLQRVNAHLESLVKTDALTNVLNRRGLEAVLNREIEYAKRNKAELSAVLVDLDDFKSVNDTKGHFVGDLVLKHVARVLKSSVRAIDWLGRVGGDEFLVLLPGANLEGGAKIAERMRSELSRCSFPSAGGDIRQTASFALVSLPLNVCSTEEILELTKDALSDCKRRGKNRVSLGTSSSAEQCTASSKFDVSNLLKEESFMCVTQPVVRIADNATTGYEVLTRGPFDNQVTPEELFRACDEHKLLTVGDLHCFKSALAFAKTLPAGAVCYLNLLPSTLTDVSPAMLVEQIDGIEDRKICIELSVKRINSDPSYLVEPIQELKQIGVMIGLDDVGFGYTSLEAFAMLSPDVIKIDGQLIRGVGSDPAKQHTVANLKKMADTIGAITTAECVEEGLDWLKVREIGIEYCQGRYLSDLEKV